MDSLPENYPADRYAHLSIYGSDNLSDWELMKGKQCSRQLCEHCYLIFILSFMYKIFIFYNVLNLVQKFLLTNRFFLLISTFLITFIINPNLIEFFPKMLI